MQRQQPVQEQEGDKEVEAEEEAGDEDEQHHDVRDVVMRLICGVQISPPHNEGAVYKPPFLSYAYAPETPVLLEGSILRCNAHDVK